MANTPGITIAVKPDLSAFREASEQDIIDAICNAGRGDRPAEALAVARALLAQYWIVPR